MTEIVIQEEDFFDVNENHIKEMQLYRYMTITLSCTTTTNNNGNNNNNNNNNKEHLLNGANNSKQQQQDRKQSQKAGYHALRAVDALLSDTSVWPTLKIREPSTC